MLNEAQALKVFGAEGISHLNGSLVEHLEGTHALLSDWGADEALCLAGLYHAVYGTDGFPKELITPDDRAKLQAVIGTAAERIVYFYAAADRSDFWPRFMSAKPLVLRDRFTGVHHLFSDDGLRCYCELTAANELEIALKDSAFAEQNRAYFQTLFKGMAPWLSDEALGACAEIMG